MNKRQIERAEVPELVSAYVDAAVVHGQAMEVDDYKKANPRAEEVAAIYRELRERDPEAQQALLLLLDHDHANVRLWAAAHALEFAPDRGEPVLEALTGQPWPLGFTAQTTLGEWRKGTLRFP